MGKLLRNFFISYLLVSGSAFAQDDRNVVLGKVPTNKNMATPCSQKRKNVKGELAQIEQDIKNGSSGSSGTSF